MTQFIFIELGTSNKVRAIIIKVLKVDFNFTTAPSAHLVHFHIFVKLKNSIIFCLGTNIKHETVFRFQILAYTLEEPLMTVNFTIIPLFQAKYKVNSSAAQVVMLQIEVPSTNLKEMQGILWHLFIWDVGVHKLSHCLHLPVTLSILLHIALFLKNSFVKQLMLLCEVLKRLRDTIETIAN